MGYSSTDVDLRLVDELPHGVHMALHHDLGSRRLVRHAGSAVGVAPEQGDGECSEGQA